MTGSKMKIVLPNGYLYPIHLKEQEQTTMIHCEHWDDLFRHYDVCNYDQIVVNLDGDSEFFRALVFDGSGKAKNHVQEPGSTSERV